MYLPFLGMLSSLINVGLLMRPMINGIMFSWSPMFEMLSAWFLWKSRKREENETDFSGIWSSILLNRAMAAAAAAAALVWWLLWSYWWWWQLWLVAGGGESLNNDPGNCFLLIFFPSWFLLYRVVYYSNRSQLLTSYFR